VVDDRVLWLTSAQWTAVGTIALVIVTAIYVLLTGRVARHARRSAAAAERAAEAAREAASATRANVPVDFRIDCILFGRGRHGAGIVRVESAAATVYLQELLLESLWGPGLEPLSSDVQCPPGSGMTVPAVLHRGNAAIFGWPVDIPPRISSAWFKVGYSFDPEGERFLIGRGAKMDWVDVEADSPSDAE